jgi:hypothetical protein
MGIFDAIARVFEFLTFQKKEKIEVMTDETHKSTLKKKEEERLKIRVNFLITQINSTKGEKQQQYIQELRKILAE